MGAEGGGGRRGRQREEVRGGRVERRGRRMGDRGKSVEEQEPPATLLQVVGTLSGGRQYTSNTGVRYIPDNLCTQHYLGLPHLPNKSFNVLSIS